MQRKEFIRSCCLAGTGAAFLPLLQGCGSSVYFAIAPETEKEIRINKSEFFYTRKEKQVTRPFVLARSSRFGHPICIYRHGDTEFSAVLMECTHNSCELRPTGNYLVCPCHGSEFSNRGIVQNPPAERNLKTFLTEVSHDEIIIRL